MKEKICCFIGHRKIKDTPELRQTLSQLLEKLIADDGFNTFLFGNMSEFYPLCHEVVTGLKEKYPHIKRIYVRSECPYINEEQRLSILKDYEDTYYSKPPQFTEKADYLDRNIHMIYRSLACVFYFNTNGKRKSRKVIRGDSAQSYPASGTKVAYDYAVKKEKRIINVF